MVKARSGHGELASYTTRGTNKVVRAGDCVLMRPSNKNTTPSIALVEKIDEDNRNNPKVRARRYYRPEESVVGRRLFHGAKELFLSDQFDVQRAQTVEGKCELLPDEVPVYCKCEGCKDWYHPTCFNMSVEEAKLLESFKCSDCSSENDTVPLL